MPKDAQEPQCSVEGHSTRGSRLPVAIFVWVLKIEQNWLTPVLDKTLWVFRFEFAVCEGIEGTIAHLSLGEER